VNSLLAAVRSGQSDNRGLSVNKANASNEINEISDIREIRGEEKGVRNRRGKNRAPRRFGLGSPITSSAFSSPP
jgi:hypothetical protein